MEEMCKEIQNKVNQEKLAGFVVNLGGIACRRIEDISGHVNCVWDELQDYAIWDFRSHEVVGKWTPFGVVADLDAFVVYGLEPIE